MHVRNLLAAVAAMALAAGPAQSADLKGLWKFDISTTQGVAIGAMTVTKDGKGKLITDRGGNALDIRSLTVDGDAIVMRVGSPEGDVVFRGTLAKGDRAFAGTLTYHDGQLFPMRGVRLERERAAQ